MRKVIIMAVICLASITLRAQSPIAQGKSKFLGNVHSDPQIQDFELYWNQVTPENAGKWGSVERTRDVYNFTALDEAYQFAKDNGFVFRYHVLFWGNQQPDWIEDLSTEEQLEEINEWLDTLALRYPDIDYLEVVNEPINDPPSGEGDGDYIDALGGTGSTGFDWIITAFTMAKERFPNAKLVINEYNIVNSNNRANTYIKIVNLLKDQGLIDVIGVQGHAFSTTGDEDAIKVVLDNLAKTELPIMVTELDIDGPTDEKQLSEYQRIFPVFWEHRSVIGVTLWGFRPGLWRNNEQAYLIDNTGAERPALVWLREYVEGYDPDAIPLNTGTDPISIYPNPAADGWLSIKSGSNDILGIDVYDIKGVVVKKYPASDQKQVILDTQLAPGTYFFHIETQSDTLIRKVVIKD